MRRGTRVLLLSAATSLGVWGLMLPAATNAGATGSTAKTALINGDSVTTADGITVGGKAVSLEQFAAQKLGYTVTVVTGAQWDAMTAAQFAHYQLLIVGDPFCSSVPASVTSNASTWAPVVMGKAGFSKTAGNRTVVGTDPEDHYAEGGGGAPPTNPSDPTTSGAEHLVQDGIAFAGEVAGATGIYFDSSCGGNASMLSTLDRLTVTGKGWTDSLSPPCGGSVALIASNSAFTTAPTVLTDANIQGWGCSVHITFPAFPADWSALAVATDTTTTPTCGTDPDTKATECGQAYVLLAGENISASSPNLSLAPKVGSDPAGGIHTVTATLTKVGTKLPLVGTKVTFVVTGQNSGVAGTCTTSSGAADPTCASDGKGLVRFSYPDTNGVGVDTIRASASIGGSVQGATATETWVSSAFTNGIVMVAGDGGMFALGQRPFITAADFGGVPGPLTTPLHQVIPTTFVGLAANANRTGYWDVLGNGAIFPIGHVTTFGDVSKIHLNARIVGIAATPDGGGYWLVGADGGMFNFGDAPFVGSLGNVHLNAPIVGIADFNRTGVWLVAADGGVFPLGDAPFAGSLGNIHLNKPITGMAANPAGHGYFLVASDGGVFPMGATFFGSLGATPPAQPVVAIAPTIGGLGYWLITADGNVYHYGNAANLGGLAAHGIVNLRAPIVGAVN